MEQAPLDITAVIDEAVAAAMPAAPEPPTPEEEPTPYAPTEGRADSSEDGNTTDGETDGADDRADGDLDDEGVVSEADAITLPDGYVAPPVADALVTEFTLRDTDGEELEVPALMVEYKANGKLRQDRLDQVVKLAQFGVYNQERENKVRQVEEEAQSVAQQREELAQALAEREAQMERLLTDENFLYAVRERYEEENSPERRAQRAEEQVQSLRIQRELEQISQEGRHFQQTELEPALDLIVQALPTVTMEELDERVMYAMQAHLTTGPGGVPYLPSSRYAAVRKYIVEDLARWAQMVHMERTENQRDPEKERLASERDRARIEAQKAKRQIGQTLKPVTRASGTAPAPRKAKALATIDDAMDSAVSDALSSVLSTMR